MAPSFDVDDSSPPDQARCGPVWYACVVSRISNEELAKALAENLDAEGNDVSLNGWVASWSPEQRSRAQENARRSIEAARQQLGAAKRDCPEL